MSPTGLSGALRALGCALLSCMLGFGPAAAETTTYAYDAAGRLIGAVDASGKVVSYRYDNAGNRTQVSNDPFFAEILPASWTSSSTSGTTGLTTANGMRDGNYASASSVHVTTSQASPWIRAHFSAPVYIDNTCVVPAAYGSMGPANVNGAVVEYSTDNGATWQSGGTVTGASAGVCGRIALRVTANSVRYRLTGTGQLAAGDIRFFSAGSGNEPGPGAPVVADKTLSVAFNTPGSVDLTPASGAWTMIVPAGTTPSKGTVSISGSTATYTPISGQSGSDVFGYQATGSGGSSNIANVYVTIGQQAAPPTVSPVSVTMPQGLASKTFDLAPSGSWTSLQWSAHPTYGTGPIKGSATISGTTVTYVPNDPNAVTRDWWYYTATGPGGTSAPAMVEVEIIPPAPVLSNVSRTVLWNGSTQIYLWPTGSWTVVNIVSPPNKGTASIYPGSHVLTYVAATNQSYTTSMQVQAVGPGGSSNIATVTITVDPPTPPAPEAKSLNVPANSSAPVTLTARQVQGDISPTFAISGLPSKGTVSLSGNIATYTPYAGQSGADTFYYTATGLGGTGGPAPVNVNITQAPLAVSISPSTTYERTRFPTRWGPGNPISVTGSGGSGSFSYVWERISGDTATSTVGGGCSGTNWTNSTPPPAIEMWFYSDWRCKVTDNVTGQFAYSPTVNVTIYYAGNLSLMAGPEGEPSSDAAAESR